MTALVVERSWLVTPPGGSHQLSPSRPPGPDAGARPQRLTPAPGVPVIAPGAARTPAELALVGWHDAFRDKRRGELLALVIMGPIGAVLVTLMATSRTLLHAGWACIAGMIGAALLEALHGRRRPGAPPLDWPWLVVALLSGGLSYVVGLHSGVAAAIAGALFAGALLRAPARAQRVDRHALVMLLGVCTSHATIFLLVWLGVLPDAGRGPIVLPGATPLQTLLEHLGLQATFVLAYVAGQVVDHRFELAIRRALAAVREDAHQEALLASARAEVEALLAESGDGLFTGTRQGGYRVGRLLGRGGMGEVYEARRDGDDLPVALKLIRRDIVEDARVVEQFSREVEVLRRVQGPHVPRVLDAGGLGGAGVPHLAMERIEGEALAVLLQRSSPLSRHELERVVADGTRALADVHAAGVVHLDVKPQNLVLAGEGSARRWVLIDFGLAMLVDAGGSVVPIGGGTPHYMAPEQLRGEALDRRADLYAFALVVYRALTGRPAFTGQARALAVRAGQVVAPPAPRRFVAVDEDLELALRVALAESPGDRFASAEELGAALADAFAHRLPEAVRQRALALFARAPWA
jgi:serine/threonine-protein kinase